MIEDKTKKLLDPRRLKRQARKKNWGKKADAKMLDDILKELHRDITPLGRFLLAETILE